VKRTRQMVAIAITCLVQQSTPTMGAIVQQAYVKASNTGSNDYFGAAVALSGDTMIVGAPNEQSAVAGVNGDPTNNNANFAGAAYVFVWNGSNWTQQAYLKASNPDPFDRFGTAVAISGNTAVVGATQEDSGANTVNGDQTDNLASGAGAAYVFVRNGTNWTQQAYLKASNAGRTHFFGTAVAISEETLVVGAAGEDSNARGVNTVGTNGVAFATGAAYLFVRDGTNWTQQAYLKASNAEGLDNFGNSISLDGDLLVVGASQEDSSATGVNGDQSNNSAPYSGAAYIFARQGTNWTQEAYLKASNTDTDDRFGYDVAVSSNTVAVGAIFESSSATGTGGNGSDNSVPQAGAVYVFERNGTNWTQQAYLKASNTGPTNWFGASVGLFDGVLLVGAQRENAHGRGVNANQENDGARYSGAAYAFVRNGTNWMQHAYLKASNSRPNDNFGISLALSGNTCVIGAMLEDSGATGVDGDQDSSSATNSGAAYVFVGFGPRSRIAIQPASEGGYRFTYAALRGCAYELERAVTLDGPWLITATSIAISNGPIELYDTNAILPQAFYRIRYK